MTRNDRFDDGDGAPSTSDIHSILASGERRLVLRFFRDRSERVVPIDDLAEYVADRLDGIDDPSDATLTLHHVHLPRLAASEVIDYDHRSCTVRYRGNARLDALLARVSAE